MIVDKGDRQILIKDTVGHDAESLLASKEAPTLAVFAIIGQSCQTTHKWPGKFHYRMPKSLQPGT